MFYYLQARYYDPQIGRFINADALVSTGTGVLGNNMFAYCNNNPIKHSDPSGYIAINSGIANSEASTYEPLNPIGSQIYEEHKRIMDAYTNSGIEVYSTIGGALISWGNEYLPLSGEYEHAAYLYSFQTSLGTYYYFSETYKGSKGNKLFSPNVIIPTLILEICDWFSTNCLVAQVHTHPDPGVNLHSDFPSASYDIYGGDRIAYELFGYPEMYIIPYAHCSGTPWIIVYSDKGTWCSHSPY